MQKTVMLRSSRRAASITVVASMCSVFARNQAAQRTTKLLTDLQRPLLSARHAEKYLEFCS